MIKTLINKIKKAVEFQPGNLVETDKTTQKLQESVFFHTMAHWATSTNLAYFGQQVPVM